MYLLSYARFVWRICFSSKLPLLLLCGASSIASGASFDCERNRCGLKGDGSYPHLVLGTVKAVASDTDAGTVYRWAKDYGYWADIPEDQSEFINTIQIMSVEFNGRDGNEEITVLMSRTDYDAIVIKPGDLVRYTPHESDNPLPSYAQGVAQYFWNLFGCIAVLCREDDIKCRKRYSTGIFRISDGVELNSYGDQSKKLAKRIDPITYLPLQSRTY